MEKIEFTQQELIVIGDMIVVRAQLLKNGLGAQNTRASMQYEHSHWLEIFKSNCGMMIRQKGIDLEHPVFVEIHKNTVMNYIQKIPFERIKDSIESGGDHIEQHELIRGHSVKANNMYNLVILAAQHSIRYTNEIRLSRNGMTLRCETSIEIMHGSDDSITLQTYITPLR